MFPQHLQRLAVENGQVRQRVILFGDSYFERFTYEGRNIGVRPFTDHVRSCARLRMRLGRHWIEKWLRLGLRPRGNIVQGC